VNRDAAEERTLLAWQRTALSLAVIGALGIRAGLAHHHSTLGFVMAAPVCAIAAFLQLAGPRLAGGPRAVRIALIATLIAAAGALALVAES
jgi:uncharacterized membrane protein YidH (DUF202 family)